MTPVLVAGCQGRIRIVDGAPSDRQLGRITIHLHAEVAVSCQKVSNVVFGRKGF
jgi:tRNA(Phe) wybutosine-synthesizing methylase Tyw3